MPTYAYQCQACGHAFDAFQKFSEDPLTDCPACPGRIRRVIHPTPVVFKGSGWYITDSKAKTGANGKGDKADAADAKPDAGEKTETGDKPAAKADKTDKADKTEKTEKAPVAASAD